MKGMLAVMLVASFAAAQNLEADKPGRSVAGIGDVDGDGRSDIAVGGDYRVQLFSGATFTKLWSSTGDRSLGRFGYTLASCDWNGDGRGDVVVAAPGTTLHQGAVSVLCGVDGEVIAFIDSGVKGSDFGYALAAGDLDGDKRAEIVVGAPRDNGSAVAAGAVFVYSGSPPVLRHTLRGDEERAWLGASVAIAGDLDHDGVSEILIGAPRARGRGQVLVVSGKFGDVVRRLDASEGDDHFGISLCAPRCINRNPSSFLAVGVDVGGTGLVRIFNGSTFEVTHEIRSRFLKAKGAAWSDDRFAYAIAAIGGLEYDGCDAIAVGAPNEFTNGSNYGAAYVFSARQGECSLQASWNGDPTFFGFGAAVANAGDVDGDRRGDVVFGALDEFWGGGVHIASPARRKTIHEWPKHEAADD